jgi:hypothetical protein
VQDGIADLPIGVGVEKSPFSAKSEESEGYYESSSEYPQRHGLKTGGISGTKGCNCCRGHSGQSDREGQGKAPEVKEEEIVEGEQAKKARGQGSDL